MSDKNKSFEPSIYVIPKNFIEKMTLFGGTMKFRNAIEGCFLVILVGYPLLHLNVSLKTKFTVMCIFLLPTFIFALVGINGESLTSFLFNFIKFVLNRRVIGINKVDREVEAEEVKKYQKILKSTKEKIDPQMQNSKFLSKKRTLLGNKYIKTINAVADYINIKKIENGIIYTKDGRYLKIVEIDPINFLLRNEREKTNIIYAFASYLKVSPTSLQFKVVSKKADINKHIEKITSILENEKNPQCKNLQRNYINLIKEIGQKEAMSRRFFLIFEYEKSYGIKSDEIEQDAISQLNTTTRNVQNYLKQCGNKLTDHKDEYLFYLEALYVLFNRKKSVYVPFLEHVSEVIAEYSKDKKKKFNNIKDIPITTLVAPKNIDFSRGRYTIIDGIYYSYLLLPAEGYKEKVLAGWTSLLINAGEGIDIDLFMFKQPKYKMQKKLNQQLRLNKSFIRDTDDINEDFDNLKGAIRSGYFLKNGISNNEDFYYTSIFITITGRSEKEIDWRVNEMEKLLYSQDLGVYKCLFRQEQAFLSTLPLLKVDKFLYERSKRNVLTLGASSMYPLTSFEMSDDNGILLGVNKSNNSMIIQDIFNSKLYKNANISILGTTGAGKTFLVQLMALRMRLKGIQTFIIAPLKGHEFQRACTSIGGEFIRISPASKTCINIMEIRKTDDISKELIDEDLIETSKLASKIQSLHIFFSLLIPDMTHEERQLLDEAFVKTYFEKGITHSNESLLLDKENPNIYKEMPVIGDVYNILLKNPETKKLATILNRFVNGSAKSFNQQTNVNLDNKYTVLDISELSGELLVIGMFVALDFVWDKVKENRTLEKTLILDELWRLIGDASNRLAAEYVLEIFKIIRGYGGSAICATQDINDFFSLDDGKYGKGVINACKTKIILNLEEDEADRVQSILKLSDNETSAIAKFERGSGLISTNNNNVTVDFKASNFEKELITTDRAELKAIMDRKQKERMSVN